jgi:hypothetical protein
VFKIKEEKREEINTYIVVSVCSIACELDPRGHKEESDADYVGEFPEGSVE